MFVQWFRIKIGLGLSTEADVRDGGFHGSGVRGGECPSISSRYTGSYRATVVDYRLSVEILLPALPPCRGSVEPLGTSGRSTEYSTSLVLVHRPTT